MISQKQTVQVRIEPGLHKIVREEASVAGMTIREVVENCIIQTLTPISQIKRLKRLSSNQSKGGE